LTNDDDNLYVRVETSRCYVGGLGKSMVFKLFVLA